MGGERGEGRRRESGKWDIYINKRIAESKEWV